MKIDEIPITPDRLSSMRETYTLEPAGEGVDAKVFRILTKDEDPQPTGRVIKLIRPVPKGRLEEETIPKDPIAVLRERAAEMIRQRVLLKEHFGNKVGYLATNPLQNIIPEIDPPFISEDPEDNGLPRLCVPQEDLSPMKSIYQLSPADIRRNPKILLGLNVLATRVRALHATLEPGEDLMLDPKNLTLTRTGGIAIPDLFPIEKGPEGLTHRLDSSAGIAYIETRLLGREVSPDDPFYRDLFEFMKRKGLKNPDDAFETHYTPWLRHM